VVSVDSHVERMTLEHNSWRFRLAPSIFFGGIRQQIDGPRAWNWTNGNAHFIEVNSDKHKLTIAEYIGLVSRHLV